MKILPSDITPTPLGRVRVRSEVSRVRVSRVSIMVGVRVRLRFMVCVREEMCGRGMSDTRNMEVFPLHQKKQPFISQLLSHQCRP